LQNEGKLTPEEASRFCELAFESRGISMSDQPETKELVVI
jgi:hypothetical protein